MLLELARVFQINGMERMNPIRIPGLNGREKGKGAFKMKLECIICDISFQSAVSIGFLLARFH